MSETITNIDLENNTAITDRDVSVNIVSSVDINQTDGTYAVVEPYSSDGSYNGRVVIYPQSPLPQVYTPVILKTFNRVGSLFYPTDAKFDYLRRTIWIADTGNNRVLKVNLNTNQVDVNIDEGMVYPHALSVDFNTGDIFIKGYDSYNLERGAIFYYKKDGTLLYTFLFNRDDTHSSSSSFEESSSLSSGGVSESSSSINSGSSSSTSSAAIFPSIPSSRSIAFDHVRSRVWWVDDIRIYMGDIRNKQIQTYDIRNDYYTEALNLVIEFKTGNAFVLVKNIHNDSFIVQINRDNTDLIASAYIEA